MLIVNNLSLRLMFLSFRFVCWLKTVSMVPTQQETQKAMLNQMVAKVTKECWDKCITGAPGSKFSSSESSCLSNCAQRYLDMSVTIMTRFQSMR